MSMSAARVLEPAVEVPSPPVPKRYKRTEVGVIPEDWEIKSLGQFVALRRGHDLTERDRRKGEVPVMGSAGPNGFHDTALVSGPGVVLGRSGASFGVAHYCAVDFWPHNTALYVTDFFGNDRLFVFYFLKSIDFSRHNSGGAQQSLNRNFIAPIKVVVPPLREQQVIAGALSDADALIESLEQLIAKKRAIKQGAMEELLTGKRRLPGFKGRWTTKSFGELFAVSGGLSASRDQLSSEGHCYLHYGDIHTSTKTYVDLRCEASDIPKLNVPLQKVSKAALLEDGDVVFVDASEDEEGTSKHVVVVNPDGLPFISGLHTIVAKSRNQELVNLFKRYCFQSRPVRAQFRFFAVGTKVSGVSKTNIAKIELTYPHADEQVAIASILSDMDAVIDALEAKLTKARQVKQGMMQELLTGRIRLV